MLKIFNWRALTKRQRIFKGFVFGFLAAIGAIIIQLILVYFGIYSSLVYLGAGYLIGMAIQYFGHGVTIEFSIMGAVLTALAITVGDTIVFGNPIFALSYLMSDGISSLLALVYRVGGIILAYQYARIV